MHRGLGFSCGTLVAAFLVAAAASMICYAEERSMVFGTPPVFIIPKNKTFIPNLHCPKMCTCFFENLEYLDVECSGLGLTEIPKSLDSKIQSLNLSGNKFKEIPRQLVKFKNLHSLCLHNNSLSKMDVIILSELSSLRMLDLSLNRIDGVDNLMLNELFTALPNLERLDLSHNSIGDIFQINSTKAFQSDSLSVLVVENCSIVDINNEQALIGMKKLNSLVLSRNRFIWFTGFESQSIEVVDLSHCRLRHIKSTTFKLMPNLKKMILSDNPQFKFFSQYEPTSTSIRIMVLKQCYILPQELAGFPNLTNLSMRGNYIRELQPYSFQNISQIEYLDVSRASIVSVDPNTFVNMKNLRYLDLSENLLTSLGPETFVSNNKLVDVNLSRNRLRTLEILVSDSIASLDISNCEITEISKAFLHLLPAIKYFSLAGNPIEQIPDDFLSKSLTMLDLSFCRLTEITEHTFIQLINLSHLNINGNRLSEGLRRAMFPGTMAQIELEDNPWRCDCSSHDFKLFYEYLKQVSSKILTENRLICRQPKNYSGLTWYGACKSKWYLTYSPVSHAERNSMYMIYTLLIAAILGGIIFAARQSVLNRQRREREVAERLAAEHRLRLRLNRHQHQHQQAQLNAPDPRDLIAPPSYEEAVLMMQSGTLKNSDDEFDADTSFDSTPLRSTSERTRTPMDESDTDTPNSIIQSDL